MPDGQIYFEVNYLRRRQRWWQITLRLLFSFGGAGLVGMVNGGNVPLPDFARPLVAFWLLFLVGFTFSFGSALRFALPNPKWRGLKWRFHVEEAEFWAFSMVSFLTAGNMGAGELDFTTGIVGLAGVCACSWLLRKAWMSFSCPRCGNQFFKERPEGRFLYFGLKRWGCASCASCHLPLLAPSISEADESPLGQGSHA